MSLKLLKLACALAFMSGSFTAYADCPYPKAPAGVPKGATASETEMVAAMDAFKAYNDDVTSFSACVEQESKGAASMQMKAMQTKKINAAVEELQSKAKEFNEQVRIFKARG